MDEQEIQIINDLTKREKIINFFKKNYKILISIIIIIILLVFGIFLYQDLKTKQRIKISEKFNNSIIQYDSINVEETKNNLIQIIFEKDKTYSPLALYYIIENDLIQSSQEINKYFDVIINDLNLEKNIKLLNIYKKALFNSNFANEESMENLIKPLISGENYWKSHALYLMGEYYYAKKNKQKAKEFYNKIITLSDSNENIKLEAQKRIQRDFSE